MSDTRAEFADAMQAAGLNPPDAIEPDKLHRFPGVGKANGNRAAWCKFFADGQGGVFGDFASNLSETWQAKREKPFSQVEHEAFKRQIAKAKAEAEAERRAKQAEAASKAAVIWQAAQPAPADHAYLVHKGIMAHGARLHDVALVIPMVSGGNLHSLQFIAPDGGKRFLAGGRVVGCFYGIGIPTGAAALCVCEGFATGATIHEATGYPVAVAFNAGNLEPVAQALRAKFPDLALIVCADDDVATKGNPGLTKATAAAQAVGASLAVPDFGADRPEAVSDFNDMRRLCGAEAVAGAIAGASAPARAEHQPPAGSATGADADAAPIDRQPKPTAAHSIKNKAAPLNWSELATRGEPPARRWALYGWIGFFVNLLVGSGGIGKTLLAQQMGSTLALERAFIDAIDRPLTVLAWFCEDDFDEIWRRQVQIAHWLGVGIEAFGERLIIMPRHGMENALVTTEYGRPMFTPLIGELSEQAADYHADVVILDNAAQLYGGGENDRHAVTFFMNGLAGALPGRAVLLLAHPARSAGSEFSGSGAWENVARNRLYLGSRLPDELPDADEPPDDDVRFLCRRKANYTSKDYRRFHYQNGVLVPDTVEPAGSGIIGHLYDQAAERAVLDGLKRLQEMGIHPSEGATTSRYLPRLLGEYKLSEGRSKAELAGAMRRLMVDGKLVKSVVGKYAGNRSPMYGLTAME